MTRFKDKVVWITGASSGIGEALVHELVKKKAKLILSSRRMNELERVKGSCPPEAQSSIELLPLDLASSDTLFLSAEAAVQLFGRVDVLINNAGVSQRSFAKDTKPEVDRKIMEVNFFGPTALTKYLLPHMLKQQSGHLVVVSSVTGKFGTPYRSAYAASKHALHGFFDSLRAELWKDHIKVTMVCPGFINTNLTIGALTGDGTPLNKFDRTGYAGKSAKWCAKKIIKAVERNKLEIYPGGREVWGVKIKRYFPNWFARIIRKAKVK